MVPAAGKGNAAMTDRPEWNNYSRFVMEETDNDDRIAVDECPVCAAMVRSSSREKHERVCWESR